ncbi:hypothetical protein [Kineosporia sp. NBRC 101677]|nr:hypothetical protein [Kineosporia sp. NBRC 101677]
MTRSADGRKEVIEVDMLFLGNPLPVGPSGCASITLWSRAEARPGNGLP